MTGPGVEHFTEAVAGMPDLLEKITSAPKHRVADHPS